MSDLVLGLILMFGLSACCFVMALRTGKRCGKSGAAILAVSVVAAILGYTVFVWDSPWLACALPFSNLIVLGNWFPVGAATLAGIVFYQIPRSRRRVLLPALGLVAVVCLCEPLLGAPPQCDDQWHFNGTCVQTTDSTCSPACAATLLKLCGINTTEQEMAELCLTRKGTRWQGLYRGLKVKTKGTAWDVEVIHCTAEELASVRGSLILSVGLDATAGECESTESGWRSDVNHSIVRLSVGKNGVSRIVDPSPDYGPEVWTQADMDRLFRGCALRIVRRRSAETLMSWVTAALSD